MDDPTSDDGANTDEIYGKILVQYNEKSSLMEEIFWDFIFSDFEP